MPRFPPSDAPNKWSNFTNSNGANKPMGAGLGTTYEGRTAKGAGLWAGLAVALVLAILGSEPIHAQTKDLSDKSVQVLMQYAWSLTPPKFTGPDGKIIEVDKKNPKGATVPLEAAREVIKVGRLSALAQSCELADEQRANYLTMMRREQAKAQWNDQQLLYISQLHTTTVMIMTGKLLLVEKEGEKVVSEREVKTGRSESCTDTERQRVKAQVTAYIGAAGPPPATKTAEPASTAPQKK
jgi:hypothetical protein